MNSRLDEAFIFAHRLHRNQRRKGTAIPYLSHLMAVASLVMENGGAEDAVIAALLHDSIEDQGVVSAEIEARFGEAVAKVVQECTDSFQIPKPSWKQRKVDYLDCIPHKSPTALLVTTADKLHNARSILSDYRTHQEAVWNRFSGGKEGTLWYYHSLSERLNETFPHPLTQELRRVVIEMTRLASG
jgi:(p)ppGpp synthase/HD superfamily hydrolase